MKPQACVLLIAGYLASAPGMAATLEVSANAPIAGSFSLRGDPAGGGAAYAQLNGLALTDFEVSFKADIDDFASQSQAGVTVLTLMDTTVEQRRRFELVFLYDGVIFSDGFESNFSTILPDPLSAGVHEYRLSVNIPAQLVELRIDDALVLSLGNDFSPTMAINQLRFGIPISSAGTGALVFDDFSIDEPGQPQPAFFDDFELGDLSRWSISVP